LPVPLQPQADADRLPDDAEQGRAEAALWEDFRTQGSPAARERLFNLHTAFARNIARRHHREQTYGDIDIADVVQHAYAGLLEALDRFDPAYGVPFRPFAAHRISGSIRDGISKMNEVREQLSWRRRMRRERMRSLAEKPPGESENLAPVEQLAELAVGLALGFILEGTGLFAQRDGEQDVHGPAVTAYDTLAWKETVEQLKAELSQLPEREQTILRQHYENNLNFDHLAVLLGISKGRVSQLHRAALMLLRKRLKDRGHFRMIR
jgi:RNA polymerase sigma factor for flagellar operon FliA